MAEKRISELTAKGSNLGANDLVEISEYVSPGVYRTRYITGTQVGAISSNFATADLTFTANRTHDISTYTLTFDGTTRVVSPGATSGDTAFSVRNNTDTADLVKVTGDGAANFYGDIYARNEKIHAQDLYSLYFGFNAISIISAIDYKSRGEIGVAYTNHRFDTTSLLTTAGAKVVHFANFGNIHMDIDKDGNVGMYNLPTSSAGLSAGQLWNNSGVINIV